MTAIERVATEFYETLLLHRYPGIAQVTSKDIERTILASENRLFLLSWLLMQSSLVPSEEFSGHNNREEKLVKWYTNIGICINPDALLARVSLSEQVPTLHNLLMFMTNVLVVDQPVPPVELNPALDILKKHIGKTINIIPPTCILNSALNSNEVVQSHAARKTSSNEKKNSVTESSVTIQKSQSSDELFGSKENSSGSNPDADKDTVVEKFVKAFESAKAWPSLANRSQITTSNSMDTPIDVIHSNMAILKETMRAKEEVSKFVIPDSLTKRDMPLDEIIEDIVVSIEEFSNLNSDE